ncbi:pimeloyl-ACP methyl ester carboxylesterase [Roseateles depolymerans]|uniref:Alpha/beta hydrolase n=1 Tax=Roseateles depolymerans TaxID=76731 RepID=A0A0U3N0A1_9BURK|nr:alpha/beta hydrolase [Roseateles depolymerans]REG21082.1 pimeloyl-ACP methyl ester carboxylesterase [Roseateles depolymerans]
MKLHLRHVLTTALLAASALTLHQPARAEVEPLPSSFQTRDIATNGTTLHVRVGGTGPAVVLIHGFGDTGDMWTPLATELVKTHRVVIPDLRGMGLSAKPEAGYDKMNQAKDIRGVLDQLGIEQADVVGHDIGVMVSYAYAASYPAKTTRLVVMDAPLPGIPPWDEVVRDPRLWHFDFYGEDVFRLVKGRERIFLDRFYNDFGGQPAKIDESTRNHYARLYALPGAMKASLSQFHAFRTDAKDNQLAMKTKLTMPVLAIGGEKSFAGLEAVTLRNAATDVTELVIPRAGHWLMEEEPQATTRGIVEFLGKR